MLGAAEEAALHEGPVASWAGWLVLVAGLLTVAVTAAYVTRLWLLTFFHQPRGGVAGHEPPASDALAPGRPGGPLGRCWADRTGPSTLVRWTSARSWQEGAGRRATRRSLTARGRPLAAPGHVRAVGSLVVAGAGAVAWAWRRAPAVDPTCGSPARARLERAFFVDDFYDRVVRPAGAPARLGRWAGRRRRRRRSRPWHRQRRPGGWPGWWRGPRPATSRPTSPGCSPGVVLLVAGVVTLAS